MRTDTVIISEFYKIISGTIEIKWKFSERG